MKNWNQASIKISVDRAMLHYLTNASKMSNIEVIHAIKDGSEIAVQRILQQDLLHSRKRSVFPNTEIAVTYSASRISDDREFYRDRDAWMKRHKQETGYGYYDITRGLSSKHRKEIKDWQINNPEPDMNDPKYNFIRCKVSIPNSTAVFDSNEIDSMLIEHVFFGAPDEHADESGSETSD